MQVQPLHSDTMEQLTLWQTYCNICAEDITNQHQVTLEYLGESTVLCDDCYDWVQRDPIEGA